MSPSYTPIHPERMYEQIVAQIEERIVSGVLQLGDQLPPERELAEQFQVSRTAVREAVKALQERGLVEVLPGRGTFVTNEISKATQGTLGLMMRITSKSRQGFAELFELREKLEPEMAALAALRSSEQDIAAMINAVETMDASIEDMDNYIAADNRFHEAIAKATHNSLFATLLNPIIDLLIEQRKRNYLAGVQSPQRAQRHHKEILDAIIRHDPESAKDAMKSHLAQVILDIK